MQTSKLFTHILANTALAGFTNMLIWFAVTFWLFLETRSVFMTGVLGGLYLVLNLLGGIWFGSLVDHNRKKLVMLGSSIASLICYSVAFLIFILLPTETWGNIQNPWLWIFLLISMIGAVVGNIRMIALSTIVTLLIAEDQRDKANGQIGVVNGITFMGVSAFSGFIIGRLGMDWALGIGCIITLIAITHLLVLTFPPETHLDNRSTDDKKVDLRGTIGVIASISGLFAMLFFAMWNNFLGGIFMSLMDAYGLSIVSVEIWGVTLAITSIGFIIGGYLVAKYGLGRNPVRSLLSISLVSWSICLVFPLVSSIWFVGIGFFLWMIVGPIAEACEQTILQKVVPLERQGRVFGFGQSLENTAAPFTAFLVGPLTEFLVMPWVRDGGMTSLVGSWWGTSPDRAIAVVFVGAGILGVVVTVLAMFSGSYRTLSERYVK